MGLQPARLATEGADEPSSLYSRNTRAGAALVNSRGRAPGRPLGRSHSRAGAGELCLWKGPLGKYFRLGEPKGKTKKCDVGLAGVAHGLEHSPYTPRLRVRSPVGPHTRINQ